MINSILRSLRIIKSKSETDEYEPIYGLTKRSLDEWLSRNPALKQDYEAALRTRSSRVRPTRDEHIRGI